MEKGKWWIGKAILHFRHIISWEASGKGNIRGKCLFSGQTRKTGRRMGSFTKNVNKGDIGFGENIKMRTQI